VLPGGTAERLLSGSPVPVAVAPNGYAEREAARAVVGVGFDNSPEAEQAVRWAAGLATESGGSLQVFSVHAPIAFGSVAAGGAFGTRTVNQVLGKELQAESEQLTEALSPELSVESRLLKGDPATLLVEHSQELDLLVLGSRGYGPIKSVLLGSVSSYVLRNAHCPVLVVPRGANGDQAP
jgi:nucleotide-binding universal stress UspA family protein